MTGWIETVVGIGYAPIAVPVGAAITAIAGGGDGDITPEAALAAASPAAAAMAQIQIQGPLNIVEIEGVPVESSGGGTVPQPFNQGTIGLIPFHENKGDTINEIVKQGAPAAPQDDPKDPDKTPDDTKSELYRYIERFREWGGTIPLLTLPGMISKGLSKAGEKAIGEVAEAGLPGVAKNDKFSDIGISVPEIPGIPAITPNFITQNAGIIMIAGGVLLLILIIK